MRRTCPKNNRFRLLNLSLKYDVERSPNRGIAATSLLSNLMATSLRRLVRRTP